MVQYTLMHLSYLNEEKSPYRNILLRTLVDKFFENLKKNVILYTVKPSNLNMRIKSNRSSDELFEPNSEYALNSREIYKNFILTFFVKAKQIKQTRR
jgi:hypothetical protein